MEYLRDSAGSLTALQAAQSVGWRSLDGFTLKKGGQRAVTWFRLGRLVNSGERDLYLVICTHQPKDATVFVPVENQGYVRLATGWDPKSKDAELGFTNTVVSLPRRIDGSRQVLLRWDDPFMTEPRPTLYAEDAFRKTAWETIAFKFAVYGVMAAMILYNLGLAFFLRDRAYFMYVLYMTAMLLYQATVRGEIKIVSMGAYKVLYSNVLLLSMSSAVLGLQFARTFLSTRLKLPRLDKVLLLLMALLLVLVGGVDMLGYKSYANTASFLITPLLILCVLGAAVARIRQGFSSAAYFLLAWTFLSLGVMFYLLYGLGHLSATLFTVHAVGLGAALESVLLSLALADRIRKLQDDREALLKSQHGLTRQAITDELTGLFNKRFLWNTLKEAVDDAAQGGRPLALVVLDVDHFKDFNDSYGHPKGDEVLAAVGQDIRNSVRDGDVGCRYGGEEFVVILPQTSRDQALAVSERIRGALAGRRFDVGGGQTAGVTISAGIACLRRGESASELLNRSDQALYAAKHAGRDQTVAAD